MAVFKLKILDNFSNYKIKFLSVLYLFSNATRKGGAPVTRSIGSNEVVSIQSVLNEAPRLEETTTPQSTIQPNTSTLPPITTTQPNISTLPPITTTQPTTTNQPITTTQPTTTNQPITSVPTTNNQPVAINNNPTVKSSTRTYQCLENQGKPMTIVDTSRGRIQLISWESGYFAQSSWTPQKRCDEVTQRFQNFSDNGTLKYITTGTLGKYKVICVSGQKPSPGMNINCTPEGLLLTLEPKDNPDQVMKELFQEATRVGSMPVRRSQRILDMEKYLTVAPLMSQPSVVTPQPSVVSTPEPTINTKPVPIQKNPTVIDCPPILCD